MKYLMKKLCQNYVFSREQKRQLYRCSILEKSETNLLQRDKKNTTELIDKNNPTSYIVYIFMTYIIIHHATSAVHFCVLLCMSHVCLFCKLHCKICNVTLYGEMLYKRGKSWPNVEWFGWQVEVQMFARQVHLVSTCYLPALITCASKQAAGALPTRPRMLQRQDTSLPACQLLYSVKTPQIKFQNKVSSSSWLLGNYLFVYRYFTLSCGSSKLEIDLQQSEDWKKEALI